MNMRERIMRVATTEKKAKATALSIDPEILWAPDKEGVYKLDVIPYKVTRPGHPDGAMIGEDFQVGDEYYRRPYSTHSIMNKVVACPQATFGETCPICTKISIWYNDYEKNAVAIKQFRKRNRVLFNIVVNDEKVIRVGDFSNFPNNKMTPMKSFGEMLRYEMSVDIEKFGSFPLLDGGYSLMVRFIEKKFEKFKYFDADRIDFKERDNLPAKLADKAHPLDDLVTYTSPDEVADMFDQAMKFGQADMERAEQRAHTPPANARYSEDDVPDDFKSMPAPNVQDVQDADWE